MKTSWFKTMAAACAVSLASLGAFGAESITLTTSNHYPWDGKVDWVTELSGLESGETYYGVFTLTAGGETKVITNTTMTADGTYTDTFDCAELFGEELCTNAAGITVKLYKQKPLGGVQLWEDGPYFATNNVGATKPEEYGYYFWWGSTVGYKRKGSGWVSVETGTAVQFLPGSCPTHSKNASALEGLGYIDSGSDKLNAGHDAATVSLGAPWRMMTEPELKNLVDASYCTWKWTTDWAGTGIKGWIVTGAKGEYEKNSIFLPAAGTGYGPNLLNAGMKGCYWASTIDSNSTKSYSLDFNGSDFIEKSYDRYYGFPIRPVRSGSAVGPGTEVTSASGTFEVDTRDWKETTLAGAKIVGGETSITLKYSPTAWGAVSAGGSVDVIYSTPEGDEFPIVKGKTEEGTCNWTPPAVKGTYTLHHRVSGGGGEQEELMTDFEVVVPVVPTAEVQPKPALNTDVEGVYTNGVPVEKTEGGQYIVQKGAEVEVKFQGNPGYFFKIGEGYQSTWSENATATSDPTEVACTKTPVQGTKCGDTAYYFMDEKGAMTMVGSGEATGLPAEFDRNSVTNVVIGEGITGIGADFFKGCESLTRVTGGKDLEDVGAEAFYSCPALEAITLDAAPDGMDAAVYKRTSFTSSGQWLEIPVVTMPGYKQVVYGKKALTDTEWTDLGSPTGKGLYDYEGYYFFKIDLISEE